MELKQDRNDLTARVSEANVREKGVSEHLVELEGEVASTKTKNSETG